MLGPYGKAGGFRGAQARDQVVGNSLVAASGKSESHDVRRGLKLQSQLAGDHAVDVLRRLTEGREMDDAVIIIVGIAAFFAIETQAGDQRCARREGPSGLTEHGVIVVLGL